ncbi:ABC transporter ATP-binding protein [Nostocoides veronense]|uniref:ABC transporter ATP-binding protein n=1 Tax=Nostocoides veronense TaxID=330836 RepID=A0ABP4Y7I3_9MICO
MTAYESLGAAVRFSNVSVHYPESATPALTDVNLEIDEGELVLVIGRTGSGKSTLLGTINGHVPHFTGGRLSGRVEVMGRDIATHRPRDLADVVGVVGQDPLAGFVTDTVEEELAYGMEQLALPPATMRKRVEETLDLLGIADLRAAPLRDLSGGQQQRVAIGSVLTTHPRLLVLDEPTSALDPTGAEEVLATLTRLVHDLGVTVVIAEHRLERVVQYADRLVEVADGRVRHGSPAEILADSAIAPPIIELGRYAGWSPLPVTIRDARRAAAPLRRELAGAFPTVAEVAPPPDAPASPAPGVTARGLRVDHGRVRAVADVDLAVAAGSVTALMGRNGAGKSSLLWALHGTGARTSGRVHLADGTDPASLKPPQRRSRVGLVPQSATDLLYLDSVGAECDQADQESGQPPGTCSALLADLAPGIPHQRHPRDLSEGQKLALVLAVQLTARPEVVLLDEPTRGLDYPAKDRLAATLRRLARDGHTVVVSTHDVEFVAIVADEVIVMAEGEIVAHGPSADVIASSPAFAPQVAKVLAPVRLLTVDQVRAALPRNAI